MIMLTSEIVRNEVPKNFTFETSSGTLDQQSYDSVVQQQREIYKENVRKRNR